MSADSKSSLSSTFLIAPDGRILKTHYGRDIGDHLAVKEVEEALTDLRLSASELFRKSDPLGVLGD
jgi:peroxiredoxin